MNQSRLPGWRTASIVVAVVVAISGATFVAAQRGGSEQRIPGVTEEQARADLPGVFESGEPVDFGTPVPPATSDPVLFGPFRIVPFGFVGSLPYEERDIPLGVHTSDPEVLRQSSLYREPSAEALPAGMELVEANSWMDFSEQMIHLRYENRDLRTSIEIWHMRPTRMPFDVDTPSPQDGNWTARMVGDLYAMIIDGGPTTRQNESGRLYIHVHLSDGNLYTLVESGYYSEETLLSVARSLIDAAREE